MQIIVFFLGIFLSIDAMTQSVNKDCLFSIKKIFRRVNGIDLPRENTRYFFDYSVKTTMAAGEPQRQAITRVKMYVSENKIAVLSDQMNVYKDLKYSYTVLPFRKMIYKGDSDLGKKPMKENQNIQDLQAQILDSAEVISCKSLQIANSDIDKEVIIKLNKNLSDKLFIKTVSFYLNSKQDKIKKTVIQYYPGNKNKIDKIEITYSLVDYNFDKLLSDKILNYNFYNSNGALIDKYKAYQLIDVSAKK